MPARTRGLTGKEGMRDSSTVIGNSLSVLGSGTIKSSPGKERSLGW